MKLSIRDVSVGWTLELVSGDRDGVAVSNMLVETLGIIWNEGGMLLNEAVGRDGMDGECSSMLDCIENKGDDGRSSMLDCMEKE